MLDISNILWHTFPMPSVSQWWDKVLDGNVYRVDVDSAGFNNLGALRAAAYREAEGRRRLVATHKVDVDTLLIQAWGAVGMAGGQPRLARATATPAPELYRRLGEPPKNIPGLIATKIVQEQPPTSTQYPWGQLAPQDQPSTPTSEPLEADDEALLGPCTCGQSPQCLPDCSRVTGLAA